MNPDRAGRVREVMEGALARDTGELPRFLDQSCGPDAELRREVESLLDARKRMGRYLEVPAAAALARDAELAPGDRIGGYEILGVIGRGGSGVVYEARQKSPDRVVALKTVRLRLGGDESRFLAEAQTLARFRHPAIAHIYEAGVHEAQGSRVPFFSMEFVEGPGTILDFARSRALGAPARLELLARVADGVHYGHQRGVIHCDLKPGNILVDEDGAPKIVDFGIARTGAAKEGGAELSGTLPYMSPEQCAAEHLDVRCDVYALGVVLYELLAGRLPIDVSGRSITEARRAIREEAPAPLQSVAPEFRGDVSAIVHKAMEKDRERRYSSAAALADDLRRHLSDHVVEAVPASAWAHAVKFARRQRVAFLSFAVAVVALITAAGVSSWLAVDNHRQRVAAEYEAYLANVAAAAAALDADDVGEARARLDSAPSAFRGWEWEHVRGRLDTSALTIAWPAHPMSAGALSADGRFLAATPFTSAESLRVWELPAGRIAFTLPRENPRPDAVAFSPDGERLVLGCHTGLVEIRSARTGEVLLVAGRHDGQVSMVSFDPAGARFATSSYDGTVRLWDATTGAPEGTIQVHAGHVLAARFSPSGESLATGGNDACIRLFRVPSYEPIATLRGHESHVEDVAWSPDGKRLVSASMDQTLRLWDVESHAVLVVRQAHRSGVKGVAWSPDGRTIASCSIDRTVRLWNAEDVTEIGTYRGHLSRVDQLQYTADGARIVSFSADGTARFWDLAHRNDVSQLKGPGGRAGAVAFSPDGELLAVAALDGTIGLWDPSTEAPLRTLSGGVPGAVAVGFLAKPRRVVAVTLPRQVHTWGVEDGATERTYALPLDVHGATITGDGRIFALREGEVIEVEAETGALLSRWNAHAARVRAVALHEGGGWIVTASDSGEVRLWHDHGRDPVATASFPDSQPTKAAFHPDGSLVAVAWSNGTVRLFAVPSLAVTATIAADSSGISALSFSPDGRRLATGSGDATFRLWDPATGRQTVALSGHRYAVTALAWSPDGRCIATGESFGNVVRLWRSEPVR